MLRVRGQVQARRPVRRRRPWWRGGTSRSGGWTGRSTSADGGRALQRAVGDAFEPIPRCSRACASTPASTRNAPPVQLRPVGRGGHRGVHLVRHSLISGQYADDQDHATIKRFLANQQGDGRAGPVQLALDGLIDARMEREAFTRPLPTDVGRDRRTRRRSDRPAEDRRRKGRVGRPRRNLARRLAEDCAGPSIKSTTWMAACPPCGSSVAHHGSTSRRAGRDARGDVAPYLQTPGAPRPCRGRPWRARPPSLIRISVGYRLAPSRARAGAAGVHGAGGVHGHPPVLPKTPNGKLDTKALPAPALDGLVARYVAPRTPLEKVPRRIGTALCVERVGCDDNFFDARRPFAAGDPSGVAVRDACAVDLPVRAIFEQPTVAALAARIGTFAEPRCRRERIMPSNATACCSSARPGASVVPRSPRSRQRRVN